jgi:hypothetical protein
MRLLVLTIHETLPGCELPITADGHDPAETGRRYRAVVLTTLRQLQGLTNTRIRIQVHPDDADDAVRFWLLPRLSEHWSMENNVFRADGWEIDFGGDCSPFTINAEAEVLCPFLCARWVHTALLGLERGLHQVAGHSPDNDPYLRARAVGSNDSLETKYLPPLPVIRDHNSWQQALESPLGPALKRAWEAEA